MIAMLHFATLVITTMLAVTAAVLLHWLLLRATFHLMRPATAGRTATRSASRADLLRGTAQLTRAFAPHR
jgi:hypothetical protein